MSALDLPTLRERLVSQLRGAGWVSHASLVAWARALGVTEVGLGRALQTLELVGRVERRWVSSGAWIRTPEYRTARRRPSP